MSLPSLFDEVYVQIYCPITNKELLHRYLEKEIAIESHGKCSECNTLIHVDALHFHSGVATTSWPVIYEGMWCNPCWEGVPKVSPEPKESTFEPSGNNPF